jgi:hypothetical protein
MLTSAPTTLAALDAQLRAEGFTQGIPPTLAVAALIIDTEAAGALACPCCERPGLAYHPYHQGQRYRGVAVCLGCGHAEEM